MEQEIIGRAEQVFRSVFDLDDLSLNREMTSAHVAGWDSLNHIRLVLAIESEFKIRFSAQEVISFQNVGDLINKISEKLPLSEK